MEKLQDIFSKIGGSGIKQIIKGVNTNFDPSDRKEWQIADVKFGISGAEHVNECINLFVDSVKRRDEGLMKPIKEEIDGIIFATSRLKDLLSKNLSKTEISRDDQICMRIFLKFIEVQIPEFINYAEQLDKEYSE